MWYQVKNLGGGSEPWKVSTKAYYYAIHDKNKKEILAYHWHPDVERSRYPHIHLSQGSAVIQTLADAHLPTRRICLEEVLRFLVEELKVKPRKDEWDDILRDTQKRHETFRTWT